MTVLSFSKLSALGTRDWVYAAISGYGNRLFLCSGATMNVLVVSLDGGKTGVTYSTAIRLSKPVVSDDGSLMIAKRVDISTSYLYKSTDGGVTWATLTAAGSRIFSSPVMSPNGKYIAVTNTATGDFYISTDSGNTFTMRASPTVSSNSPQVVTNSGVLFYGVNNRIWKSIDYGATWTDVRMVSAPGLYGLSTSNGEVIIFYNINGAGEGYRNVTYDLGVTWQEDYVNFQFGNTFTMADNGLIVGVGGSVLGSIIVSDDYGLTFTAQWDGIYNNTATKQLEFTEITISRDGKSGVVVANGIIPIGFNIHGSLLIAGAGSGSSGGSTPIPTVTTYYLTGKDSLGVDVYWSSVDTPDLLPATTAPPATGAISNIKIVLIE